MDDIGKQALAQLNKIAALSYRGYGTLTQQEADALLNMIEDRGLADAEIARLRQHLDRKIVDCGLLDAALEKIEAMRTDWHAASSHYAHWDREGKAGAACPACKADNEFRIGVRDAIARAKVKP